MSLSLFLAIHFFVVVFYVKSQELGSLIQNVNTYNNNMRDARIWWFWTIPITANKIAVTADSQYTFDAMISLKYVSMKITWNTCNSKTFRSFCSHWNSSYFRGPTRWWSLYNSNFSFSQFYLFWAGKIYRFPRVVHKPLSYSAMLNVFCCIWLPNDQRSVHDTSNK